MRKAFFLAATALVGLGDGGAAGAARGRTAPHYDVMFVPLDEITTPIFGNSRIEGALSVTLVIEARNIEDAAALKTEIPSLRASSLETTIEFSRLYASGFLPVNAARLSADLNVALKRDHPGIARVLITRLIAVPA